MRRDMDLVRFILSEVEGADGPVKASALVGGDRTFAEVVYHKQRVWCDYQGDEGL